MERKEARLLLDELLKDAEDLRNKRGVGYRDVQEIAGRLIVVADRIFGPNSREKDDARISVLSPEQLEQMSRPIRKIRMVHRQGKTIQILKTPDLSEQEYYRKTLSKLDEAIIAMLCALR